MARAAAPGPLPDADARRAAMARYAELAVPAGALGRLAEPDCWLAAAQGTCPPRPPAAAAGGAGRRGPRHRRRRRLGLPVGVTARQVSARAETPARRGARARRRGFAARRRRGHRPLPQSAPAPDARSPRPRYHVRAGTGASTGRTRSPRRRPSARSRGAGAGRRGVDSGADLLVPAASGGATTPASVLVAAVTGAEPVAVVGRGSGIDDEAWMRKAAAIRDALRRAGRTPATR